MSTSLTADYLFEVSWEVCNKVGGIHTVISTKAKGCVKRFGDKYILIGPDVWRRTRENPEFEEDEDLFSDWKEAAIKSGHHVRIGRWKVIGTPIVILIDFTPYIDQKDAIFARFWDDYRLDSITGQWDYIEPALFGYGAGKIIEHFADFHITVNEKVVAHFQEWMTGTGLLYLKKNVSRIAHVFTCHATVLGRTIAGSGQNLYSELTSLDPEMKAQELDVLAKYSLEKTAAHESDVFTTVSNITAEECRYTLGRPVDLVTPNGFELDFVPEESSFRKKRIHAKKQLKRVAEAVLGEILPDDITLIGTSGRYEFRNKGIDLFIEALGALIRDPSYHKPIMAFFLIPANQHGPKNRVLMNLEEEDEWLQPHSTSSRYLTHYLVDSDSDPIIHRLTEAGIENKPGQNIRAIFIPNYLDGEDGVLNLTYYDTLIGLDYTIFPSYYEPWGYTPLESLAFSIPTMTTDLAGFGQWVEERYPVDHPSVLVLSRNTKTDNDTAFDIAQGIRDFILLEPDEITMLQENARKVASVALWDEQLEYFWKAYISAIEALETRHEAIIEQLTIPATEGFISWDIKVNQPKWTQLIVESHIPEELKSLEKLSKNLWWCWDRGAIHLFRSIDPKLWKEVDHNPVKLLLKISYGRLKELKEEQDFRTQLDEILSRFENYMTDHTDGTKNDLIAYFSMEYGLHSSLKLYSGGLGVLAGDYLKQASDDNISMVAVGLFYRYGYFTQKISSTGQQLASYDQQNFTQSAAEPLRTRDGKWQTISLTFPGRNVFARIWKVAVGKTDLYLLDTDYEANGEDDRTLTHHLYGGGKEHRLKQEILLGMGGIRLLRVLGVQPAIYHLNEGHAAFAGLERMVQYINHHNLSFDQAKVVVNSTTLFTTHTPVPAGHDIFDENLIRMYLSHLPGRLKIEWNQFIHLGQMGNGSDLGRFSMSILASRLAQEINGVSRLHGKVSQKMFSGLFPGYFPDENHISYVTNGVHYPTWTADLWRDELELNSDVGEPAWDRVGDMDESKIWSIRCELRGRLLQLIHERIRDASIIEYENPSYIRDIKRSLNPDSLIIGFARRFATYKRALLLFRDENRLRQIVNNPDCPVIFIFAGKAHPNDGAGQNLIREVVQISKKPEFIGKIIFLQNYDMELARYMVSGVDVWLNTPTRPLEASGTSGQKAVMNGGLHFSVLDGWWVEGYEAGAGWALSMERTYLDQELQDELDSDQIYTLLEEEITPSFFNRDEKGIPQQWINFVRKSMTEIAPRFTSHRMITDYGIKFYDPLIQRSHAISENRFSLARHLISWKKKIIKSWDELKVINYEVIKMADNKIIAGKSYKTRLLLDLNGIDQENIGVELVIGDSNSEDFQIIDRIPYQIQSQNGSLISYELEFEPVLPGIFEIGTRIFVKNKNVPHRSELPFVRWI